MPTPDRYLTLSQVAERLSTPAETVRYWVHVGKLRAYKPGARVLVRETDLAAFVEGSELGKMRAEKVKRARAQLRGTRS